MDQFVCLRGQDKSDDIFAYGTLLHEVFTGGLPHRNEAGGEPAALARLIAADQLTHCLNSLDSRVTERLKRLIQVRPKNSLFGCQLYFLNPVQFIPNHNSICHFISRGTQTRTQTRRYFAGIKDLFIKKNALVAIPDD